MMLLTLLAALLVAAPSPAVASEAAPPVLRFVNGTPYEVSALYVSFCGAQDYSGNLLARPGHAAMVSGATVDFRFPPGCYDLHATVDVDGGTDLHEFRVSVDDDMLHQWRIAFGGAQRNPAAAEYDAPRGSIEFSNRSSRLVVAGLFLTACGGSEWGGDELDGAPLGPGEAITMEVAAGCWDMYARTAGGEVVNTDGFEVGADRIVRRWVTDRHARR